MSVVVEADDVDWRKRKPKKESESGRPRVRKKSEVSPPLALLAHHSPPRPPHTAVVAVLLSL
jgi:hypothetical protein